MASINIPKPPRGATHYKVDKNYRVWYYKKDRYRYGEWVKYMAHGWHYGYRLIEPPTLIQTSLTEKIIDAW